MIIKEVTAKNFGQFQNKKVTFAPGLNVIYGENESGKSTLHTFIRGMLFGIKKQRGRASKTDVYSRYEPWENEAYYAGSMRLESDGKVFRLSRSFQKAQPKSELICETDGEVLSVEQGDLSVLLGDMNETVYDNTVSIGQLRSQTEEGLALELRNYMANYQGGQDAGLDIQEALSNLKKKKKEQEALQKQKEQERDSQKKQLENRMEYIREELQEEKEALAQKQEAKQQLEEKWKQEERRTQKQDTPDVVLLQKKRPENIQNSKQMLWAMIVAVIAFAACMFAPSKLDKGIIIGIAVVLIFILFLVSNRNWKKMQEENEPSEENFVGAQRRKEMELERAQLREKRLLEQEKLRWNMEHHQEEIQERQLQLENVQSDYDAYCEAQLQAGQEEDNIRAISLAAGRIEELTRTMQQSVGAELKKRTSDILCELTEGRYRNVQMDENFQMGVHSAEHYIPLEQLSRGTIDQVYFALRMAVSQIFCQEEPMPVILDDVFAMYDEKRLAQTLKWLGKQKKQVILFTCHKREKELLDEMGISYTYQSLN